MSTEVTLAASAMTALEPLGLEAGKVLAKSAASDLWAWVKKKLPKQAAAVEEAPGKKGPRGALEDGLSELLQAQPNLITELQTLLDKAKSETHQTAKTKGDNNTTTQTSGTGNTVNINR